MNYWITVHWPPRINSVPESQTSTGVWVPDGRQQAADDMRVGDHVIVYESKSGRTEIRQLQDGSQVKILCEVGREGMICYGKVDEPISADPDTRPTKYADNSEIWWRWHAPVTVLSRSGFVSRSDLLQILGYQITWNLRGFGDHHSGLKKISEVEYNSLVEAFHSSRPVELPPSTGRGGGNHGDGGEGIVHLNLKKYVAANPVIALNEPGVRTVAVEYEFPTNDRADIVMVDVHNRIIGVEIEPKVDDTDFAGPLQAIKYRYMLGFITNREPGDSRAVLIAHKISKKIRSMCKQYDIEWYEVSRRDVESWLEKTNDG